MADRPIIFSAPMVRALLDGRKTQTRRVLCQFDPDRDPPHAGPYIAGHRAATWTDREGTPWRYPGAKGSATGDRLWVRETWRPHYLGDGVWNLDVSYPADGERRMICDGEFGDKDWNWPKAADRGNVTPLHMPRWASRLTLTVTDVRVQRLQEISEADAVAEGIQRLIGSKGPNYFTREISGKWSGSFNAPTAAEVYSDLWNSLHGPGAWDANPWVVALTFTVQRGNIDQMPGVAG